MTAPKIIPIKHIEYDFKQSKYQHVAKLPTRSLLLGVSGGGKTVLLQNLILDIYRGCFSRIYIFSHSIDIDASWYPVKEYIEKEIKPLDKEQCYFDHYDPEALANIINTQKKVV